MLYDFCERIWTPWEFLHSMPNLLIIFLFLIFPFISLFSVESKELRILFTSGLESNISGCYCSTSPKIGLIKLATYLEAYRSKYPDSLLVDTGNFLSDKDKPAKNLFVIEMFQKLRYNAQILGDKEWVLSKRMDSWPNDLPFLSNSTSGLYPSSRFVQWNNKTIAIVGITSEYAFRYSQFGPKDFFLPEDIPYLTNALAAKKSEDADFHIVLAHATSSQCQEYAKLDKVDLVLCGSNNSIPHKNSAKIPKSKISVQTGSYGNFVGEIVLHEQGKKLLIKSFTSKNLITEPLTDHPEIQTWLQNHKEFDER